MELDFVITFQAVEDSTIITGKTYKILFQNYSTNGSTNIEKITPKFANYDGKTFDIKYGNENWCTVNLTVIRSDSLSNASLEIFCGAEEKISFIKIPYDQTLSFYEFEQEENKDDQATPDFTLGQVVISIGLIIVVLYLKGNSRYSIKKN
jgi:hypothetical protein